MPHINYPSNLVKSLKKPRKKYTHFQGWQWHEKVAIAGFKSFNTLSIFDLIPAGPYKIVTRGHKKPRSLYN
jgi:hypothetical protein